VLLGWRAGAAVAILAMTVTNLLLTGPSPVGIANTLGMTLFAVAGGLARRVVLEPSRGRLDAAFGTALLFAIGLFVTLLFSVAADTVGFAVAYLATPEGAAVGTRALPYVLLMGLVFNLGPALLNALLFATATPAVIAALRSAGHVAGKAEPATSA
jgi:hypothetical protein